MCFPRYGRGDCSEFGGCGEARGAGQCEGGLCACAPGFCGANCSGVLRCMHWDVGAGEWTSYGLVTTAPAAYTAARDGFLHCRTESLMATSFAGVCVHDYIEPPSLSNVSEHVFGQNVEQGFAGLDSGTIAAVLTLLLCTFANVYTVRWARQHRQQKTVPRGQRDPVWWPIIKRVTYLCLMFCQNLVVSVFVISWRLVNLVLASASVVLLMPLVALLWLVVGLKNALVRAWVQLVRSLLFAAVGVGVSVLRTEERFLDVLVSVSVAISNALVKSKLVAVWLVLWIYMCTRDWLIGRYVSIKKRIASAIAAWKARQERLKRERLRRAEEARVLYCTAVVSSLVRAAAIAVEKDRLQLERERIALERRLEAERKAAELAAAKEAELQRKRLERAAAQAALEEKWRLEAEAARAAREAEAARRRVELLAAKEALEHRRRLETAAEAAAAATAAQKVTTALLSRVAELKRKRAVTKGGLSAEEKAELAFDESNLTELLSEAKRLDALALAAKQEVDKHEKEKAAAIAAAEVAAVLKESAVVQARFAELTLKQEVGELSAAETAELASAKASLTELETKAQSLEASASAAHDAVSKQPLADLLDSGDETVTKLNETAGLAKVTEDRPAIRSKNYLALSIPPISNVLAPARAANSFMQPMQPLVSGSLAHGRLPTLTIDLAYAGSILDRERNGFNMIAPAPLPDPKEMLTSAKNAASAAAASAMAGMQPLQRSMQPMISGRIPMDDALRQLSMSSLTGGAGRLGAGIGGAGACVGALSKGLTPSVSMPACGSAGANAKLTCRRMPVRSGIVPVQPPPSDTDRGTSAASSLFTSDLTPRGEQRIIMPAEQRRGELDTPAMSSFLGTDLGLGGRSSRPGSAVERPPPPRVAAPPHMPASLSEFLEPGRLSHARMNMGTVFAQAGPQLYRSQASSSLFTAARPGAPSDGVVPMHTRRTAPTLQVPNLEVLNTSIDAAEGEDWEYGSAVFDAEQLARGAVRAARGLFQRPPPSPDPRAQPAPPASRRPPPSPPMSPPQVPDSTPLASRARIRPAFERWSNRDASVERSRGPPPPGFHLQAGFLVNRAPAAPRPSRILDKDGSPLSPGQAYLAQQRLSSGGLTVAPTRNSRTPTQTRSHRGDVGPATAPLARQAEPSKVYKSGRVLFLRPSPSRLKASSLLKAEEAEQRQAGQLNWRIPRRAASSFVVAKPAPALELDPDEERLKEELEQFALFSDVDVFTTRCDRGYLDALVRWHTVFATVCQPHPAIGTHHPIDLEQQVQCFWTCVLVEFALAASLSTSRDPADFFLSSAFTDGALAAFIAGAVGLLGCRAVFVLCGTAGRGHLRNGRVPPPRGWDIGIEFLSPERRVFCRSLGGNVAFLARWLRAAAGWVLAWAISVLAAAIAAERIVGQTARPLARTFASWGFAQIVAWLIVEPLGVALLVACVRLTRYACGRARTVPFITPTTAMPSRLPPPAGAHNDKQLADVPVLSPQKPKLTRPFTRADWWAARPHLLRLLRHTKARHSSAAAKYQVELG